MEENSITLNEVSENYKSWLEKYNQIGNLTNKKRLLFWLSSGAIKFFRSYIDFKHFLDMSKDIVLGEQDIPSSSEYSKVHLYTFGLEENETIKFLDMLTSTLNSSSEEINLMGVNLSALLPSRMKFFSAVLSQRAPSVRKLNLSGCFPNVSDVFLSVLVVDEFFEALGEFSNLTDLNISNNGFALRITKYRDDFDDYKTAKYYLHPYTQVPIYYDIETVIKDGFTELSKALKKLSSLETLNLSDFQFDYAVLGQASDMFTTIAQMPKLKNLILSGCGLGHSVYWCRYYDKYEGKSKISAIYRIFGSFAKIPRLERIDLSNNRMNRFDDDDWRNLFSSIMAIANLKEINLSQNYIDLSIMDLQNFDAKLKFFKNLCDKKVNIIIDPDTADKNFNHIKLDEVDLDGLIQCLNRIKHVSSFVSLQLSLAALQKATQKLAALIQSSNVLLQNENLSDVLSFLFEQTFNLKGMHSEVSSLKMTSDDKSLDPINRIRLVEALLKEKINAEPKKQNDSVSAQILIESAAKATFSSIYEGNKKTSTHEHEDEQAEKQLMEEDESCGFQQ